MRYENSDRWLVRQKQSLELLKFWFLAIRPKTLTAGLVPIIAGTVLAHRFVDHIDITIAFFALLSSIFIQIGTNLINDALDFKKGADSELRIGPRRVTQSGFIPLKQVLMGGFLCFALALLCGIPLVFHGGWPFLILLLVSVTCGYLYTGGPFPLAYTGLGDLFVFIFYGLIATTASFYLQTGFIDKLSLLAAVQIGLLATAVIAMNNLRDIVSDSHVNKKTMAVRFGKIFGKLEITFLTFAPFAIGMAWTQNAIPLATLFPMLVFPLAYHNIKTMWLTDPGPSYNVLFVRTAAIQLLFVFFLVIGLIIK